MSSWRGAAWLSAAVVLPVLLTVPLVSCGPVVEVVESPLLDGLHEPDVLVESSLLANPPSFVGNRLVSGWLPWAKSNGLAGLVPASDRPARLEIVNLKKRKRALVLLMEVASSLAEAEVSVSHAGEELSRSRVGERVRLELPKSLPLGRVALDLHFSLPGIDGLAVREARVQPSLETGSVEFREKSILQRPTSAVDFVRELPAEAMLVGGFRPPQQAGPNQKFRIVTESRSRGLEEVWQGSEPEELKIPLPEDDGPVRIRLLATGGGEACRWENLRIVAETQVETSTTAISAPDPPRIVILYVFDALRADSLGHLGGLESVSPTLDRLAAEGVTFEDHISVAPNTKPSIKSLFIGRPFLLQGHERLPPTGPPTLAESFAAAGYRTVALSGSPWVGESFGTRRGFQHRSRKAEFGTRAHGSADYNNNAERVHEASLEWIDAVEDGEKAFLYMHTMHPHNPYAPPEPFLSRYVEGVDSEIDGSTQTLLSIKQDRLPVTAADRARLEGLYAGGLAYNDDELAKFMKALEERFDPGEVLMVFTSDHGEELFDHGGVLHGYTLYREQLWIPLMFWWPGVLEPSRIAVGTDHLDLSATLHSLVGESIPEQHGTPLWDLVAEPQSPWSKRVRFAAASSVAGGIFMAQSADATLIWAPRTGLNWGMGQGVGRTTDAEYLFDRNADPQELENRAALGGLEGDWLRARLAAWVERGKLEELGSDVEEQVDDETLERLRALGYVD